jgi:hypothetical protein
MDLTIRLRPNIPVLFGKHGDQAAMAGDIIGQMHSDVILGFLASGSTKVGVYEFVREDVKVRPPDLFPDAYLTLTRAPQVEIEGFPEDTLPVTEFCGAMLVTLDVRLDDRLLRDKLGQEMAAAFRKLGREVRVSSLITPTARWLIPHSAASTFWAHRSQVSFQ